MTTRYHEIYVEIINMLSRGASRFTVRLAITES